VRGPNLADGEPDPEQELTGRELSNVDNFTAPTLPAVYAAVSQANGIKTLANVALAVSSCGSAHCFRYRDGRLAVNESRQPIPPPGHVNPAAAARLAVFHHYDSKSLTHVAFKWLRGRASTGARYADADALNRAASYVAMEREQALVPDARAAQALPFLRFVLLGES
jgi:hypothetical protein